MALIGALILIAAFTPPVSADFDYTFWGKYYANFNGDLTAGNKSYEILISTPGGTHSFRSPNQFCTDHGYPAPPGSSFQSRIRSRNQTTTGVNIGIGFADVDKGFLYHFDTDNLTIGTNAYINPFKYMGDGAMMRMQYYCGGGEYYDDLMYVYSTNASIYNVTANFTATPTQGSGPVYVSFTDTSTGNPNAWNWSISPLSGWWASPTDLDNEDITIYFTDNGNYTVSHGASNAYTSDIETKTDYIWIYNSSATVTTGVTAQDMYSGYPVQGAQVNLLDVENSSWSNTTTGANGKGEITTLMHHTINAYASAGGYGDNEALGLDADGSGYVVVLTPSGFANVSEGAVTAYVTVVDDDGSFRIPDARVDVSYGGASYSITTNAAGVASFVVPNQTNVLVHARKAGYTGASKSFNSGTGSGGDAHVDVEVRLAKTAYTPTITATTLPGGGTPTPTADPFPCDADHPENCQRKQTEMANILVGWGPDLILFFIMLTIVGGAKLIAKR